MRSVPEWIGKNDDERVPPRVRLRVFEEKGGRCHKCRRKIRVGEKWTCEHVEAIINGGANRESKLDLTCSNCLPEKNADDLEEKSKTYKLKAKHLGVDTKPKWRWSWGR